MPSPTERQAARSRLFGVLALVWIFPSLGALGLVIRSADQLSKGPSHLPLEFWIAAVILLLQLVFAWMGRRGLGLR